LFFGFAWDAETRCPWNVGKDYDEQDDEDEDWEERYARVGGGKDALKKLTVEVDTHCSGECPMPLVAVKASKTRAWRGNPMEVTSLEVKPEWEQELRAFCDLMGIDVKDQTPKWWLVSDWN
jgi:hypothetical protein